MRQIGLQRIEPGLSKLLAATTEGIALGVLAAVLLVGSETLLNRYLQQGAIFLPVIRLTAMASLGAIVGGLASATMAVFLANLRRLGRPAAAIGVVGFGLLAIGAAWVTVRFWRQEVFPPATPGSISRSTAIIVGTMVCGVGALLFTLRAAEGLRLRGGPGPLVSRLRQFLAIIGFGSVIALLAANLLVPWFAARRAAGHPSVILISIDTLRADRLGVMGNQRKLTPHLDKLGSEGAVFLQATSTSPWTLPSHGSVFTSMLPFDHHGRWYISPLRPQLSMLAERFRDAGYRTAAFTGGGWLDGDRGFYQGFEIFEKHNEQVENGPRELLWAADRWLNGLDASPYFVFVHTYEPHTPYLVDEFAAPGVPTRFGRAFTGEDLRRVRSGEWELTLEEQEFVADLYDGDVANADREIGAFLTHVEESRGLEDTIIVLFSDHGEDLWDHEPIRSPDHGHSLYEELLHVPLVFWSPGRVKPGTRVSTPVSLIDVAPTLLALAGLPSDLQHQGLDLVDTLVTGREPLSRPVFAESVEYGPDRFSARSGDLKVILTPYPGRVHLDVALAVETLEIFDLAVDPSEQRNIAPTSENQAAELVSILTRRAMNKLRLQEVEQQEPRLKQEEIEQLRALGYIQ